MMRSLFSGVSGLRVHQTRMDVIGNNIANVNTVGFKASRMTFADAISQRISGASADNPDTGRAGRNPMQIGLGVNVGGIDNIMTQGAAQRTDRPLDLTIQGDGFFIVSDNSGTFFTRAGNIDWNGRYFSIGGMRLMGWNAVEDPLRPGQWNIEQGTVTPLSTPARIHHMEPRPTSRVDTTGNLNPLDAIHDELNPGTFIVRRPVEFYDTVGGRYVKHVVYRWHPPQSHQIFDELGFDRDPVTGALLPTPGLVLPTVYSDNTRSIWTFEFCRGAPPNELGPGQMWVAPVEDRDNRVAIDVEINAPGEPGAPTGVLMFGPQSGQLIHVGGAPIPPVGGPFNTMPIEVTISTTQFGVLLPPSFPGAPTGPPTLLGNEAQILFSFNALSQNRGMNITMRMAFADGNPPGTLQDIMVGPDGVITGRFSNGHVRALAQIPLAFFQNPAGLERVGNNLWVSSTNSGWFDGVGNVGNLMPGTLEMSNVDLSNEFTEMITTQRGFQANSRVISTSDDMLNELVNLRR